MRLAYESGASLLVLPELALTGYTCADLFFQRSLLDAAEAGLSEIIDFSREMPEMFVSVGLPVAREGQLYNCAAAVCGGILLGIIPKSYIPNYGEFYEKRWFSSGLGISGYVTVCGVQVPFGTDIIFEHSGVKIGVEICEDLWSPLPPSIRQALAGAQIILNLSASDELIGKHDYLVSLINKQSASLHAAYIYASAGAGESSTDLVFAGSGIIAENGQILSETERFQREARMAIADVDCDLLLHERLVSSTWGDAVDMTTGEVRIIASECVAAPCTDDKELLRPISATPFVPSDPSTRFDRCKEIISIQSAGLRQRLEVTGCRTLVVGVSGGLDSTLALLVAHNVFLSLGLDPKGIIGITMPGFGTTDRTYDNATALVKLLSATLREISISKSVMQHFADIGHDPACHDVTYENSQARERTQILMDCANQAGGMVLGTGDLSELALGWCTYNGDQMSMYGVNASVPKTLVKYLVKYFADTAPCHELAVVLNDIIATPISPELLPASANGDIAQKTEDLVGPYELHDFVLYNMLRYGFSPAKIFTLAGKAFRNDLSCDVIKHWMKVFYRRFFNQQFKRSCMPDGPKIGSVCLSPRGDWRMPSDASASLWLKECEAL